MPSGPSGASKAAIEVFSAVYRTELKPFGIDVVVASAGNMKTGGPAQTAAALARITDGMTSEHRELYGKRFGTFADRLNSMQAAGIESATAAARVIEIAEQHPAPSRAAVGPDAEEMLRAETRCRAGCASPEARRPELIQPNNQSFQGGRCR